MCGYKQCLYNNTTADFTLSTWSLLEASSYFSPASSVSDCGLWLCEKSKQVKHEKVDQIVVTLQNNGVLRSEYTQVP